VSFGFAIHAFMWTVPTLLTTTIASGFLFGGNRRDEEFPCTVGTRGFVGTCVALHSVAPSIQVFPITFVVIYCIILKERADVEVPVRPSCE